MAPRDPESTDWQVNYPEIKMRSAHLLRTREWTDCTFSFEAEAGNSAQIVEAHKLILAMASPVFAAKFYGSVGEKEGPIVMTDIDHAVFTSMLNYIYTDEVEITSIEQACDLFRVANMYILVHLEKKCIDYLCDKVTPDNVCYIYELSCLYNENELKQKCLEMFSANTSDVLKGSSFKHAQLDTLKKIYSLDSLDIDNELDLFEALVDYTDAKMDEIRSQQDTKVTSDSEVGQSSVSDGELNTKSDTNTESPGGTSTSNPDHSKDQCERRKMVPGLIEQIRFLTLTPAELADCDDEELSLFLTDSELLALYKNISGSKRCATPIGFSVSRVPRQRIPTNISDITMTFEVKNIFRPTKKGTATMLYHSKIFYAKDIPWRCKILKTCEDFSADNNRNDQNTILKVQVICLLNRELQRECPWKCEASIDVELILPFSNNNSNRDIQMKQTQDVHLKSTTPRKSFIFTLKENVPSLGIVMNNNILVKVHVNPKNTSLCNGHIEDE